MLEVTNKHILVTTNSPLQLFPGFGHSIFKNYTVTSFVASIVVVLAKNNLISHKASQRFSVNMHGSSLSASVSKR